MTPSRIVRRCPGRDTSEAAIKARAWLGPIHGGPFTAKESIDIIRVITQRRSPIFQGWMPTAVAIAVARLKAAGDVLLARCA